MAIAMAPQQISFGGAFYLRGQALMKKIISILLTLALSGSVVFSLPALAKAESAESLSIQSFGSNQIAGYFNQTTKSLTATLSGGDYTNLKTAELLMDGTNLIASHFVSDSEIDFPSLTSSTADFQALVPGGSHTFTVRETFKNLDDTESIVNSSVVASIVADYTAPTGVLSYTLKTSAETKPGTLKIGDQIIFTITGASESLNSTEPAVATYNGKKIEFVKNKFGNYDGVYTVENGDPDQPVPLQMTNLLLQDEAGNYSNPMSTSDIEFQIFASSPTAKVTVRPTGEVQTGTTLNFSGTGTPGVALSLEIHSAPIVYNSFVLPDGTWNFAIDSSNLEIGDHTVTLNATDANGNITIVNVGSFFIIAKPTIAADSQIVSGVVEESTEENGETVLALAKTVSANTPVVASECATCHLSATDQEVATSNPQIFSATDSRDGVNWAPWILILALVALASALAAAGYYGYEWIVISRYSNQVSKNDEIEPHVVKDPYVKPIESIETDLAPKIEASEPEEELGDKERPPTRW